MINKNIPTEMDSLKVRIPYKNIKVINYKLEASRTTTFEGGEIDVEEFKKECFAI